MEIAVPRKASSSLRNRPEKRRENLRQTNLLRREKRKERGSYTDWNDSSKKKGRMDLRLEKTDNPATMPQEGEMRKREKEGLFYLYGNPGARATSSSSAILPKRGKGKGRVAAHLADVRGSFRTYTETHLSGRKGGGRGGGRADLR